METLTGKQKEILHKLLELLQITDDAAKVVYNGCYGRDALINKLFELDKSVMLLYNTYRKFARELVNETNTETDRPL